MEGYCTPLWFRTKVRTKERNKGAEQKGRYGGFEKGNVDYLPIMESGK